MTITQIFSLIGYMLVCSFTPGPGNILSLNTTSKYGWKNSRRLILGICAGYATVQALCTAALYFLNEVFSQALTYVKFIGCAYMLWLAIHIILSKPEQTDADKKPTFLEGYLLQLVNVKIYFYISSLLSGYFIPNIPSLVGLIGAGVFAVSIGSLASLTWAFLGVKMQKIYNKYFRGISIVLGAFLCYSAILMVLG